MHLHTHTHINTHKHTHKHTLRKVMKDNDLDVYRYISSKYNSYNTDQFGKFNNINKYNLHNFFTTVEHVFFSAHIIFVVGT